MICFHFIDVYLTDMSYSMNENPPNYAEQPSYIHSDAV